MDQNDLNLSKLNQLNTKFLTHETQCEERWKTIFVRLEILEKKMDKLYTMSLAATGTVVVFLGGIILTLLSG
jgi:uncharacterized protein VirK/YbjX